MKTTTITTIRQAILNGKSLTEDEFMFWNSRYLVDDAPDFTTEELQNYIDCYPEQFNAILGTHDSDVISHWYTISSVGWYSLAEPDNTLQYDRGQVYVVHVGTSSKQTNNEQCNWTPPPPSDDDLDWL